MSSDFALEKLEAPYDEPDIVVFHEVYRPAYLGLSKRLVAKGIPYIVVPHGCLTEYAQKKKILKKKVANWLLFGRFLSRAHLVQYLTRGEKERSVFSLPCRVIPNGTDAAFGKTCFSECGVIASYIGRLDFEIKGIDILLDALSCAREDSGLSDFKMHLYGPGDHRRIRREIESRNLGDSVVLHDPVFGEEKKQALDSSDFFVQTSRSEGLPMGLIEAMAFGLPCLVTEGTGMGPLIERSNAGWRCGTCAKGVAAAFLEAINSRGEWEDMSKNAAFAAKELYSWDGISDASLEAYAQVVATARRGW